jgi:hypothetical protein
MVGLVFKANFNNISVKSWQSVLLVEETRVPGENHWSVYQLTFIQLLILSRGRHGRMVVRFKTTCAINAYHLYSWEFEPCSWQVCDLRQISGFLRVLWFPPPIKQINKVIKDAAKLIKLKTGQQTCTNPTFSSKFDSPPKITGYVASKLVTNSHVLCVSIEKQIICLCIVNKKSMKFTHIYK